MPEPNPVTETESSVDRSADWSLRARADTYIDTGEKYSRLSRRLRSSSASVTGIAGQRGTGKSSLALRVLADHKAEDTYTQLIHAPTGYESREFLASVFQTICEHVVARIDGELRQQKGLRERAAAEDRRLLIGIGLRFLGCVLPLVGAGVYATLIYNGAAVLNDSTDVPARDVPVGGMILSGAIALVGYALFIFAWRSMSHMWRDRRLAQRVPDKVGLRIRAVELLEHLRFETTQAKTERARLSLAGLALSTDQGRRLSARPLSIHGLTAQFRLFLTQIGDVYPNPIVLCLDELDKIEDPGDLDRLLRGLKGVLGHCRTHFLFTVSEDALARFAARGRGERDIVESAFENVVVLERVDMELADEILMRMYGTELIADERRPVSRTTVLLWLFGGGIPREIMRHAIVCLEADVRPMHANPMSVWEHLFRVRMEEIATWIVRVGGEDNSTYEFFGTLKRFDAFDREEAPHVHRDLRWAAAFATDWMTYLSKVLGVARKPDRRADAFARAAIEMVIGATAMAYVVEGEERVAWERPVGALQRLFEVLPANVRFAGDLTVEYLEAVGIDVAVDMKGARR